MFAPAKRVANRYVGQQTVGAREALRGCFVGFGAVRRFVAVNQFIISQRTPHVRPVAHTRQNQNARQCIICFAERVVTVVSAQPQRRGSVAREPTGSGFGLPVVVYVIEVQFRFNPNVERGGDAVANTNAQRGY